LIQILMTQITSEISTVKEINVILLG